jgi:hypothetical protein
MDELDRIEEVHDLDAVVMFGVAPAKTHLPIDQAQQSSVGVAGQILQHMIEPAKGRLAINDPFLTTQQT